MILIYFGKLNKLIEFKNFTMQYDIHHVQLTPAQAMQLERSGTPNTQYNCGDFIRSNVTGCMDSIHHGLSQNPQSMKHGYKFNKTETVPLGTGVLKMGFTATYKENPKPKIVRVVEEQK